MRSTASELVFIGNTNMIELRGLRDELSGEYINDATVTVTIRDLTGTEMDGQQWPATMPYVDGSRGIYRVPIVHSVPFTKDTNYIATITASAAGGTRGEWGMPLLARTRRV